jgi:hypothetical protein
MPRIRNIASLPLAINVFGPMAFKKNANMLEIWLPKLAKRHRHQAAIGTDVDSTILGDLPEYSLDAPSPTCYPKPSGHHNPPPQSPCVPYEDKATIDPPTDFFVHIRLPRPKWIVGYSPVPCSIFKKNGTAGPFTYAPVGFRLIYENCGTPTLKSSANPSFSYSLEFDPADGETQLEAFIAYSPYNFTDYDHAEAKSDFGHLVKMLGLKLDVEFQDPFVIKESSRAGRKTSPGKVRILNGPAHDCKAPVVLLK